jgi:hypothetical protein
MAKETHLPEVIDAATGVYVCLDCVSRAKTVTNFGLTVIELGKAADAYRAAPSPETSSPNWISVKEKEPPFGAFVLVVINGVVQFTCARFCEDCWEWPGFDDDVVPKEAVTHWMSLPKSPSAVTKTATVSDTSSQQKG